MPAYETVSETLTRYTAAHPTSALTEDDVRAVRILFSHMPAYGYGFPTLPSKDVPALADVLLEVGAWTEAVKDRIDELLEIERQYGLLIGDVQAMRRLLGTAPEGGE